MIQYDACWLLSLSICKEKAVQIKWIRIQNGHIVYIGKPEQGGLYMDGRLLRSAELWTASGTQKYVLNSSLE